jgi:DNA-binding IclR family transcriptional regulator
MFEEHDIMPYEVAPADLEQRLADVALHGYEAMQSQQTPTVWNLSVPIMGPNGSVLAALTCPFVRRLENPDAPDRDHVLALLRAAGDELSVTSA